MPRAPRESDFNVEVEGVGTFVFGRRSFGDEIKIQVEYARIIEGVEPTDWLQAVGGWISVIRVLLVRAPDGWSLDGLDPLEPDTYAKLNAIYGGLSEKESSFRRGAGAQVKASGA